MQLQCDSISVLGSRHGILFNPVQKNCGLIRFDRYDSLPLFELEAGIQIGEEFYTFPLCNSGIPFDLYDQRISPAKFTLIGIVAKYAIKVTLEAVTPFRPGDAEFSTTPVISFRLSAESMPGQYRWISRQKIDSTPVLKLRAHSSLFKTDDSTEISLSVNPPVGISRKEFSFSGKSYRKKWKEKEYKEVTFNDTLVSPDSVVSDGCFSTSVGCEEGNLRIKKGSFKVYWCAGNADIMEIYGKVAPFYFRKKFPDNNATIDWLIKNGDQIFSNAEELENKYTPEHLSPSLKNLMSLTLHSWLMNTWWTVDSEGNDWFSVWEGNCYYHSTVDVEFTQAPFYLTLWPELLGIQLKNWTRFVKPVEGLSDEMLAKGFNEGEFLSHDMGSYSRIDAQDYPHEMEVEETANYILLLFAYYKKTGDANLVREKLDAVYRFMLYLNSADTTGNGIPDRGCANTIDDGSPAIQFGREQIYLAVKTLAALSTGLSLLNELKYEQTQNHFFKFHKTQFKKQIVKIRTAIEKHGWVGDHFVTALDKQAAGLKNPWTGEPLKTETVPGWDAPHIYTANTLAILDMVGYKLPLDEKKIKKDLVYSTKACLREYGCAHTDFREENVKESGSFAELAGAAANPGWISMNMLRDIAAFYRGVDFSDLTERYWAWQVVTNSQKPALFFESFGGNNLSFYPRGVTVWAFPEAMKKCKTIKPFF